MSATIPDTNVRNLVIDVTCLPSSIPFRDQNGSLIGSLKNIQNKDGMLQGTLFIHPGALSEGEDFQITWPHIQVTPEEDEPLDSFLGGEQEESTEPPTELEDACP